MVVSARTSTSKDNPPPQLPPPPPKPQIPILDSTIETVLQQLAYLASKMEAMDAAMKAQSRAKGPTSVANQHYSH
ncbi:hypothetical protein JCGZ_04552 [Jatropha curcas]|uniref:Uncharacterized protein n=1 Tax=Jatropha curcas TaxID=180498 RepID=A0A067LGZ3_JATCU|nr:hypothetical protein JCGZ_04552 [Jatropha curcas]